MLAYFNPIECLALFRLPEHNLKINKTMKIKIHVTIDEVKFVS